MAEIIYLRPGSGNFRKAEEEPSTGIVAGAPARLSIIFSPFHLAAVLVRETVKANCILPRRVTDLIDRMELDSQPNTTISTISGVTEVHRNPAFRNLAGQSAKREAPKVVNTAVPPSIISKSDAFFVGGVSRGQFSLLRDQPGGNSVAKDEAQLKLLSSNIAVPDDILVAKQNRTSQTTFSFSSLEHLEKLLSEMFRHHQVMISSWAEQADRPPLKLRYQAKTPFGRMAHKGAQEASELRSIAVKVSRHVDRTATYFSTALSLTS